MQRTGGNTQKMGRMDQGMLQQKPRQLKTKNRAHNRRMGKQIIKPPGNLYEIRKQAGLTQIMKEEPEIETWLNQDYKEQDIDR